MRNRPSGSTKRRPGGRPPHRIGRERGRNQVIEPFDELGPGEGLRDDGGGRKTVQLLRDRKQVRRVDDGLAFPARQSLRNIRVRLVTDSQKDDIRLDRFRQFFGNDRGSIAAASDAKLSGSRVLATDTSMPLRANALARAWPILPKPIIA
jgi:hypothetical protein